MSQSEQVQVPVVQSEQMTQSQTTLLERSYAKRVYIAFVDRRVESHCVKGQTPTFVKKLAFVNLNGERKHFPCAPLDYTYRVLFQHGIDGWGCVYGKSFDQIAQSVQSVVGDSVWDMHVMNPKSVDDRMTFSIDRMKVKKNVSYMSRYRTKSSRLYINPDTGAITSGFSKKSAYPVQFTPRHSVVYSLDTKIVCKPVDGKQITYVGTLYGSHTTELINNLRSLLLFKKSAIPINYIVCTSPQTLRRQMDTSYKARFRPVVTTV